MSWLKYKKNTTRSILQGRFNITSSTRLKRVQEFEWYIEKQIKRYDRLSDKISVWRGKSQNNEYLLMMRVGER